MRKQAWALTQAVGVEVKEQYSRFWGRMATTVVVTV